MNDSVALAFELAEDLEADLSVNVPTQSDVAAWIKATLAKVAYTKAVELNIRVVSSEESQSLNATYRGKDKPTNVLSFESDLPDFVPSNFIGDLAICAAIVQAEALEQRKQLHHHWAHMCIHGVLHLLQYDHINEQDAEEMEAIEVAVLAELGIDDPYQLV